MFGFSPAGGVEGLWEVAEKAEKEETARFQPQISMSIGPLKR